MDEMSMVPEELLGTFEHHLSDAVVESRYTRRADKSQRPFGGYNIVSSRDFFQSPPIRASVSLCIADNSEAHQRCVVCRSDGSTSWSDYLQTTRTHFEKLAQWDLIWHGNGNKRRKMEETGAMQFFRVLPERHRTCCLATAQHRHYTDVTKASPCKLLSAL